jgi:hypothetical protein
VFRFPVLYGDQTILDFETMLYDITTHRIPQVSHILGVLYCACIAGILEMVRHFLAARRHGLYYVRTSWLGGVVI